MLNIPRPPYLMLGYNRTITPTNIRFAQHWARGGGGRKKKRGKNSNLPNTFDDDCSIRLFYRLLLQGFCSRFWSPSRTGQVQDKGFFRGPNILDEGEEGGGSLQGHHQLACVQTLPPLPSEKKCGFFFEEGGGRGGGVCTHRLAVASLAIQSLRRRQPYSTDKSSCNAGNWAKRALSIFGFKFWGS